MLLNRIAMLLAIFALGWTLFRVCNSGGDPPGESEPPPFRTSALPTQTRAAPITAAPTPALTPSPPPLATYRVTYYGPGFEGQPVACGSDVYGLFDPTDPTTAASGDGGPSCGTRLDLCSGADGELCQVVVIKDACGGCGPDHLDLSRAAWDALGQPVAVYVRRTWTALVVPPVHYEASYSATVLVPGEAP